MVEATTKAIGVRTMAAELGIGGQEETLELRCDASAARPFASRRGLGEQRHVETRLLRLQAEVLGGRVRVVPVSGSENPADLMTKFLRRPEIQARANALSMAVQESGRWSEETTAEGGRRVKSRPLAVRHSREPFLVQRVQSGPGYRELTGSINLYRLTPAV